MKKKKTKTLSVNSDIFDMSFLRHESFNSLTPDAKDLLIMFISLLHDAHQDEISNNEDIRSMLSHYSPNNKLLESSKYISWGQGLQHLIADIITGKDITSPTFKHRTKH